MRRSYNMEVVVERHERYEKLTDAQKVVYDALPAHVREHYLSTIPQKRQQGVPRAAKLEALSARVALARELRVQAESYHNRLAQLLTMLETDKIKAADVGRAALKMFTVPGMTIKVNGPKKGPRKPKIDPEEAAIAAMIAEEEETEERELTPV